MFSTKQILQIKEAVSNSLAENGLIQPFLTRSEVIKIIGRHRYELAVKSGLLTRHKSQGLSKNASVRIDRKQFIEMLNSGKI